MGQRKVIIDGVELSETDVATLRVALDALLEGMTLREDGTEYRDTEGVPMPVRLSSACLLRTRLRRVFTISPALASARRTG